MKLTPPSIWRTVAISAALLTSTALVQVKAQESTYQDPAGRFSIPIPSNWKVASQDNIATFSDPEAAIRVYALSLPGQDMGAAIAAGWKLVNPAFTLEVADKTEIPGQGGVEALLQISYKTDEKLIVVALAQRLQGQIYLLLVDGTLEALQKRGAQLGIIQTGFSITDLKKTDLSQAKAKAFDTAMQQQFGSTVEQLMQPFNVPGAVVAVIENNKIIYSKAFGHKDLAATTPINSETQFMIGSVGKSLTTTMMATLVDDGAFEWNTPAIQILPSFKVADPLLSQSITMKNLVCACTGVPRRDFEFILNAKQLGAEQTVQSLGSFEFYTKFGEAFQYSNQMVATGGFIAALAAGSSQNLMFNYQTQLQKRVLRPVGMNDTTLSFATVTERSNYAQPNGLGIDGNLQALKLETEKVLLPVAPAGSHWSTVGDMARYLVMQLQQGVSSTGKRVVSSQNLLTTWQPQVPVSAQSSYGLGWFVDQYKGLPVIHHGGNTLGFTSDLAFLPERGLGIVILTNAQGANFFTETVRARFMEMLFEQSAESLDGVLFYLQQKQKALDEAKYKPEEQPKAIVSSDFAQYLGQYHNTKLGSMRISIQNDQLYADFGEFSSLLKTVNAEGKPLLILNDPPLAGVTFDIDLAKQTLSLRAGAERYDFKRR
jgi:CubicO group peptidase (beta-lactamase class C family)